MKVIIVGYGKMGKIIEETLHERGHEVVGKASSHTPLHSYPNFSELQVDAAIDFSTPTAVLSNIHFLQQHKIPTVVGTTGWHEEYNQVRKWVEENHGAFLHASNFSVGVNLFFNLNQYLAKLMTPHPKYHPKITEIHHLEKLDAPSGTAISLAEGLLQESNTLSDWYCKQSSRNNTQKNSIEIEAIRKEEVKGIHEISYQSSIDKITIKHEAFNRKGFSIGAVIAAEWLQSKKGIFTMKDVLQLS